MYIYVSHCVTHVLHVLVTWPDLRLAGLVASHKQQQPSSSSDAWMLHGVTAVADVLEERQGRHTAERR